MKTNLKLTNFYYYVLMFSYQFIKFEPRERSSLRERERERDIKKGLLCFE